MLRQELPDGGAWTFHYAFFARAGFTEAAFTITDPLCHFRRNKGDRLMPRSLHGDVRSGHPEVQIRHPGFCPNQFDQPIG
jgi:hypothetical protein